MLEGMINESRLEAMVGLDPDMARWLPQAEVLTTLCGGVHFLGEADDVLTVLLCCFGKDKSRKAPIDEITDGGHRGFS